MHVHGTGAANCTSRPPTDSPLNTEKDSLVVVGPKAVIVKLEKEENEFTPENVVMVWMMALPSDTSTEVTTSSTKKDTCTLFEE